MTTPSNTPQPSGAEPAPAGAPAGSAASQSSQPYASAPPGPAPHDAAPYGAAPYGAAPSSAGPAADTSGRPARNVLGIVALGIGIIVLLSSTASLLVQAAMLSSGDYVAIGAILGVFSIVQGLLALAAIACGGIGLALKGRAKGAAGIGLGIGVTALWSVLGSVLYGVVVQFMG